VPVWPSPKCRIQMKLAKSNIHWESEPSSNPSKPAGRVNPSVVIKLSKN
jgi:hypothetical protein